MTVDGSSRKRLAAVGASNGALTSWKPTTDARVTSLALQADGSSVYLGGFFDKVNGSTRRGVARVGANGGLRSFRNDVENREVFDIVLADKLYVASGGGGGKAWALNTSSGNKVWSVKTDGDVQAVGFLDGHAYFGGHFDWTRARSQRRLIKVTKSGNVTSWLPTFNSGPSVWAVTGKSGTLYAGGEFTRVNNKSALRFVAFGEGGSSGGGDGASLIASGATWRYLDNGSNQGTAWRNQGFNDSGWKSGRAELGYGDTQTTTVNSGSPHHITTYFRRTFNAPSASVYTLDLGLVRDDGTVVYVNGVEIARSNMPSGAIGHTTLASSTIAGSAESRFNSFSKSGVHLAASGNVVAVEIHQVTRASSDISFNLRLEGAVTGPGPGQVDLIAAGATWKYLDNGSNQGTAWRNQGFNDSGWKSGRAELGYGDTQTTTVNSGSPHHITTYFRRTFNAPSAGVYTLDLGLLRDDGAVVYLNGVEIARSNMPSGSIGHTTRASSIISGSAEKTFNSSTIPGVTLAATGNVLAVELHQHAPASSDISFNLRLKGTP